MVWSAGARRLNEVGSAGLASVITGLCHVELGPPVVDLYLSRRDGAATAIAHGRRSVVLAPEFVHGVLTGQLPRHEAVAVLAHASLAARAGPSRQGPTIIFWSTPWGILAALGRPVAACAGVGFEDPFRRLRCGYLAESRGWFIGPRLARRRGRGCPCRPLGVDVPDAAMVSQPDQARHRHNRRRRYSPRSQFADGSFPTPLTSDNSDDQAHTTARRARSRTTAAPCRRSLTNSAVSNGPAMAENERSSPARPDSPILWAPRNGP